MRLLEERSPLAHLAAPVLLGANLAQEDVAGGEGVLERRAIEVVVHVAVDAGRRNHRRPLRRAGERRVPRVLEGLPQ